MNGSTLTCPKCHGAMRSYERSGVTVDQCVQCRGIFLDRGELDHLIDAEQSWHSDATVQREGSDRDERPSHGDRYGESRYGDRGGHQRKRRKSFLDDLFD
jgi:Zn-finger nucleic acid-binding protein